MASETPRLSDLRIDDTSRTTGAARAVWPATIALVVLALAGGGWYAVSRPKPIEVNVTSVGERVAAGGESRASVLNASGYVTARRRATVSSKITGKVVGVFVEEGMAVKAGQVLARLDDTVSQRYLALAEAELVAARRNADETAVRIREAQLTLARTRTLVKEGITGQADLDRAEADVDALKARLALSQEQVAVSAAQVAVRRTEIDDMVIRAPFSGVAVTKDAQPGEMISPVSAGGGYTRTGICTIVDMASLEVEVDVNESYIHRVSAGQPVEAVLDAYPDWRIPAHVIIAVPTADRQKATVLVRVGFDRLDPRMLPDMGVKVSFLDTAPAAPAAAGPVLVVPTAAVRTDGAQSVVFVVMDGKAARRAVRVGRIDGKLVEVTGGVVVGERVIVDAPPELKDGQTISVRTR